MASSILLEGQIDPVEGDISSCEWTGKWHFFKDGRVPLNFRYKRKSLEVSLELVHYVSFIANGGGDLSAKPRSRGRVKGWRKYRDQGVYNQLSGQRSEVGVASFGGSPSEKLEREEGAGDSALAEDETEDDPRERTLSTEDTADATSKDDALKPAEIFLTLSNDHPLFGLYEGSFDVRTPQGPVPVQETFFLHAFAGADFYPAAGLDVLPQTDWWANAQLLKHMELDNTKIFGDLVRDHALSVDKADGEFALDSNESAAAGAQNTEKNPGCRGMDIDASVDNGSNMNDIATSASTPRAGACASVDGTSNPNQMISSPTGIDSSAYPELNFILGFGRNTYGRFSLFGIYNKATGSLKCERKYLTGRTSGLKRSSRHGIISGVCVNGDSGDGTPGEPRMTTRTHRVPSFFLPEETGNAPRHSSFEKKQRSYSSLSGDQDSTATKRRKAQSSAGDYQNGTALSSTTSFGRGRNSLSNSESSAAIAEMDRKFNDPNNHEVRYRPVYYDEETNSYYEGWWASGCRNGRGLCLYSDKLMYEGNWFMGRETGRGVLMTGNRKVIYRGDWIDGCFHGSGTFTFANGDTYKGDWREGKRHGKGEYYVKKYDCTYVGDWKDNKRHGRGVFTWADGSKYDGDWEKNYRLMYRTAT